MSNILIADDNEQIIEILSQYASDDGYTVYKAFDGKQAFDLFQKYTFEVILLDVMMPQLDGFEVCRRIRKVSNTPIIMITARGEDFERIMGLDTGADDYIVKPFSPGEVMARIRAILRRIDRADISQNPEAQVCTYDNLVINLETFEVTVNQNPISLTKKEVEILWVFAQNPNKVYTRDHLLDSIWGYDYYGDTRTVDSHMKRLRTKLNKEKHENWDIKTVWGMGYKLEGIHNEK